MAGSDTRGDHDMLSQPAVGSELAGYRIQSLIGRGGMGVVYRARDLALDRKVALKLLAPDLALDARFRERFLRESRLAASLDHPAIVPIYDAGEVAGQLYIAMRLVAGTDLKRLLAAEGPLAAERALVLLEQIADALDAAHERGLVHRDVKPSNVLLDERGHCYLADFGLSRRLADQSASLGPGRSLGTIDYVAPEQIRGEAVDARTDLYALGCLLYECLAGYPPFVRRSETAVVFAHLEDEPPTLPGLAAVISEALAKEPDARFQSGRELVAAAREALEPKRPRRRRIAATVAAVLLAGGGTAGGLVATHSAHIEAPAAANAQSLPLRANALNVIDARTHRLISTVPTGRHRVSDIAFLGRSAWLSIPEENRLVRVDVSTKRVRQVVKLPWTPTERFAVGGRLVWVREARNLGTDVLGIDGRSGRIVRRLAIGGSSIGIAYGAGSLWLIGGGEVVRVDPRSGRTLHHYAANADLLTYADGALWAAGSDGSVWKIDPVGNTITAHTRLHPFVSDLAVGGGSAWVSVVGDDTIYRLSEDDLAVQQAAPAGTDPERVSIGRGAVWVADTAADGLSRLTTSSGMRAELATKSEPTVIRFHDGVVWVPAARGLPPLAPITGEELRISTPFRFFNLDPVSRVFPMDEQLTSATCANLLRYGDTGLEPELAAAMPTISRDGRTYTFSIRPGFRFSPPSNAPVTAATVRYTIERTLSPYAHGWDYAPDIVGVAAYRAALKAGKPAHIVGIHAHGRTLSITLTRPAGDFLARLAMTVFCPVPLATPLDPSRITGPLASDGPYYVASAERDRIVLLRNPNYAGRRSRRAARIVITDDVPTPKAVALVDSGRLDYLPQDFAGGTSLLGPSGELARASGPNSAAARAGRQRFFLHPQPMFDTIVFNSARPLFRNARLRLAVAAAIDRAAMAHAFFDAPAEHAIPGIFPGYGRTGIAAPDLRTARHLAGSERRTAVLLMPCDSSASAAANILRGDLARIGMTVRIVRFGGCDPRDVAARFANADLMIGTNLQCGPCERDPAEVFTGLLAHGAWGSPLPPGGWNRAALQDRLEQAAPLRGRARVRAYRRLDDVAGRSAPFVVYGSYLYGEYFGARVGCLHFPSSTQGVDLGALCLRKP